MEAPDIGLAEAVALLSVAYAELDRRHRYALFLLEHAQAAIANDLWAEAHMKRITPKSTCPF